MKIQSNNNKGMFVSVGNKNAIAQKETANDTHFPITTFYFGKRSVGVALTWLQFQRMENQYKQQGYTVKRVAPGWYELSK